MSKLSLKKIVIRSSDAIDQINFIYNDGKIWSVGQDCGKEDVRAAIEFHMKSFTTSSVLVLLLSLRQIREEYFHILLPKQHRKILRK